VSSRIAAAIIAVVLTFLIIFMVLSRWHHERPRETGALDLAWPQGWQRNWRGFR
jgi:hypothetical protein